ncbi:lipopolysaccharide kinase InaA family protein [Coraliomargarita sp. SDUM461004]|uniref:Lipopolysaccharide kinase InaA family protein n=1 Tax=Thalassobacterium sedimentorum TaxID=3041258 RepID=A0ABU1ANE3_9BACT|nr:lipopolysaccharide kinase InaA family protein [Coraliomargarita sp. SDUM461004]MDQ8195143.1 lipopolysaccharide kinase InaA family protein [Coraliomargarita sp. SDUM461004]
MPNSDVNLQQNTDALQAEWSLLASHSLPLDRIKDRSAVFVRKIGEHGGVDAYIKIYANQKYPLQRYLRKCRSRNEAHNLLFFSSIGIRTPKIIAWGERRNFIGRIVQEFIITEAIPGALQLDQYVSAHCPDRSCPAYCQLRDQIIDQLGRWTASMHAQGFIHEDLKWRNLLVKPQPNAAELYWIDCPKGGFRRGPTLARKKLKDCATLDKLARVRCSLTERQRFLTAYLNRPLESPEVAALCEQIQNYRARRFDATDDRQRHN